ncbi:MAG: DNA repair protein RadC [Lachnospiraceae bacterium]|nr:DNA repair protein RadC [Lachnospiraceae bacterium]
MTLGKQKGYLLSHISLKNLPESERPYERFLTLGAEALSDAELLAIILKTGTREHTSLELAREILSKCQGNLLNLYELSHEQLMELPGIGPVKAIQLKVIAELSRRIVKTGRGYRLSMDSPASIANYYMEDMRHRREEVFLGAFFDAKCKFLGDSLIATGSVSYACVSPMELFRKALLHNAVMIVVLHNHPSGDPNPSREDIALTGQLTKGAELLGMTLTDHIVIGDNRYFSFCENHMLST